MSIWCDRKLFNDPFRRYSGLVEMAKQLTSSRFVGAVRSSDLHGMVLGVIPPHSANVGGDLAAFDLGSPLATRTAPG